MSGRCVLLSGGVGGAKLAEGMAGLIGSQLTIVANTGDDFEHLGLNICPDIDTLLYTLSDEVNRETGWGRRDESWQFLATLEQLGGDSWFRLGDRDLAIHVLRSEALAAGQSLTYVTQRFARRLGINAELLPASNDPVRTFVSTPDGELAFQDYFVRARAVPAVTSLEYRGADSASITDEARQALADPKLEAVVIAPSNPWLSIAPMLAIPSLLTALQAACAPVVAVSPIVAGAAIKGPTAKIMRELGLEVTAGSVARHYRGLIDGFILDDQDRNLEAGIADSGLAVSCFDTVMTTQDKKVDLAGHCLAFARSLKPARQ
jgi:LPPG:FO 2-phospho-L-lactate transferase